MLFSAIEILKSHGFKVSKVNTYETGYIIEPLSQTSIMQHTLPSKEADLVFCVFNNAVMRKELLSLIEEQKQPNNKMVIELTKLPTFKPSRLAFSNTFEWYIGELMIRRFSAFSYATGVDVNNLTRVSDSKARISSKSLRELLSDKRDSQLQAIL